MPVSEGRVAVSRLGEVVASRKILWLLVTRDLRMSFPLRPHEAPLRRAMKLDASRAYSHFRTWRFAASASR